MAFGFQRMERIGEPQLIRRHVEPHHIVLHVGPYAFGKDHTPLFLGTHLKESQGGKLILLDAQTEPFGKRNPYALEQEFLQPGYTAKKGRADSKHAGGAGRPIIYIRTMEVLKKNGRFGQMVVPRLHVENAMDASIRDDAVDRIIDRGSASWILSGNLDIDTLKKQGRLEAGMKDAAERLAANYHRMLKPGGQLIMLFETEEGHAQNFRQAFHNLGFLNVKEYSLIPEMPYKLPNFVAGVQQGETELNQAGYTYLHALVATKKA